MKRLKVMAELFQFFWHQKRWWLLPLVAILLLVGLLLILGETSVIAPLVYPLF